MAYKMFSTSWTNCSPKAYRRSRIRRRIAVRIVQVRDLDWGEVHVAGAMEPVKLLSPWPQANVQYQHDAL